MSRVWRKLPALVKHAWAKHRAKARAKAASPGASGGAAPPPKSKVDAVKDRVKALLKTFLRTCPKWEHKAAEYCYMGICQSTCAAIGAPGTSGVARFFAVVIFLAYPLGFLAYVVWVIYRRVMIEHLAVCIETAGETNATGGETTTKRLKWVDSTDACLRAAPAVAAAAAAAAEADAAASESEAAATATAEMDRACGPPSEVTNKAAASPQEEKGGGEEEGQPEQPDDAKTKKKKKKKKRTTVVNLDEKQIKVVFEKMDVDGSGSLTFDEIKTFCDVDAANTDTDANVPADDAHADVQKLFDLLDRDKSGEVDLFEMVRTLKTNEGARLLVSNHKSLEALLSLSSSKRENALKARKSQLHRMSRIGSVQRLKDLMAKSASAVSSQSNVFGQSKRKKKKAKKKKKKKAKNMKRKKRGTIFEPQPQMRACSECGAQLPATGGEVSFCGECGAQCSEEPQQQAAADAEAAVGEDGGDAAEGEGRTTVEEVKSPAEEAAEPTTVGDEG